MLTIAQLAVEVVGNTDSVNASLAVTNDQVEKSGGLFSKMGDMAKGALGSMMQWVQGAIVMDAVNFVMQQASDIMHSVFDEAGAMSSAEDLLAARLKSTGDASGESAQAINDYADQLSQMSGVTESTILQGDNMLLTFTNIGKSVFPDATLAMTNLAISMNHGQAAGADFQSAAIQLGKALDNPIAGITALSRVGVTFTQQQKDAIKAMMDSGNIAGAQAIILKELNKEFGGTAQAAGDTFGGAITKLKNIIIDFGANALGKVETWLQPIVAAFVNELPDALSKAGQFFKQFGDTVGHLVGGATSGMNFGVIVQQLQAFGQTIRTQVLPIALQLSDWFQKQMLPAIQSVMPAVQNFADFIVNRLVPAYISIEGYVVTFVATLTKTFLPIFQVIEPIIVRVAGWLLNMGQQSLAFLIPKVQLAFQAISQFATEMSTRLEPFIHTLVGAIQQVAAIIGPLWSALWPYMSGVLKIAWDLISGIVVMLWHTITSIFKIGADLLSGNWGQLWADIKDMVDQFHKDVVGMFGGIWKDIESLFGKGVTLLETVWGGLWAGLSSAASGAWNDVKGVVAGGVNGVIDIINGLINAFDTVASHLPGGINIPDIPHVNFASGGIMPYSGLALVHQDEMIALNQGARIYNKQETRSSAMGAPGQQIILNGPTSTQLMQMFAANQAKQKALTFGGRR